jgi:hypothetical protein
MKKILLLFVLLGALAAGCSKVTLQRDYPSVPKESYEPLPQ